MYHSVLYEWLKRLNIKVHQPFFYTYQSHVIQSKNLPVNLMAFAKNQILVEHFATFNMKTYRKLGTTYTNLFKIQMKKLFLESKKALALERMNLHLQNFYDSLGFKLNAEVLAPFKNALLGEALFVQHYEYEEYIKMFLVKVAEMNKKDKDFEMEPGFPRFVFTSVHNLIANRGYILPQEIYMSLGRLALLIHRLKWKHDEKTDGLKNKKESTKHDNSSKNKVKK